MDVTEHADAAVNGTLSRLQRACVDGPRRPQKMLRFRLSTALALIAVIAVATAVWVSFGSIDRSVKLVDQTPPVLGLGGRSETQSYEFAHSGTTHTLTVTFTEGSFPSQIYPQIEWAFEVSDGTEHRWLCNGLVVRWEMNSADDGFLTVDDVFEGNTPYEVIPGPSYRIVKYWWVSNSSKTSIEQNLHFYLIANDSNNILAEHRLTIVVNVVVPNEELKQLTTPMPDSVSPPDEISNDPPNGPLSTLFQRGEQPEGREEPSSVQDLSLCVFAYWRGSTRMSTSSPTSTSCVDTSCGWSAVSIRRKSVVCSCA